MEQIARNYTIRDARPDEYDAMLEVALAAYEQYTSLMPHWTMYRDHLIATMTNDDRAERIVAAQNNQIIGGVLLYPSAPHHVAPTAQAAPWPELRLLAVAPWTRGIGVGRALLEECIARARRSGASAIGLHTEDVMAVAQRMYVQRGFVRSPEHDFSPSDGVLVKGYRLDLDGDHAA